MSDFIDERELCRTITTQFKPAEFCADDVNLIDIAAGLSKQCRFQGQYVGDFLIPVAQHSCYVGRLMMRHAMKQPLASRRFIARQALIGTLHDGSEGYLGDMITPNKRLLPDFKELEEQFQSSIYLAFLGNQPTEDEEKVLKWFDNRVFNMEARELGRPLIGEDPIDEKFTDYFFNHSWWSIAQAREQFTEQVSSLLHIYNESSMQKAG